MYDEWFSTFPSGVTFLSPDDIEYISALPSEAAVKRKVEKKKVIIKLLLLKVAQRSFSQMW